MLTARVDPLGEPRRLPSLDHRPPPSACVIWRSRLRPGGSLEAGVLLEAIGDDVISEKLVAEELGSVRAYARTHRAAVVAGCSSRIGLLRPADAGKVLVHRSYHAGWALGVLDVGSDLASLAASWTSPERSRAGADTFALVLTGSCEPGSPPGVKYGGEPTIGITNLGPATVARWRRGRDPMTLRDGTPALRPRCGPIAGLLTLANAYAGEQLRDLRSACRAYGIPVPERTGNALDDLRAEAAAMAQLYFTVRAEVVAVGLPVDLGRVASTGSIASVLLTVVGLPPLVSRFDDLPDRLRGAGASAFHGAWFEGRCLHEPRRAASADLSAAYGRVASALDACGYLTAKRVKPVDVTAELRRLLGSPDLAERALDRTTWQRFRVTLVRLQPRGDVLPVKVGDALDLRAVDLGGGEVWVHWQDTVASTLRTGRLPAILEAVRLGPVGRLRDLQPVRLPSGRVLDLGAGDDLFATTVVERDRLKADTALDQTTKARRVRFAKMLPNAVFGSLARIDRARTSRRQVDAGIAHDGSVVMARNGWVERPGPWCWLPLAGAITAGTRLVMQAVAVAVERAGGSWLHVAADSIAVAIGDEDGDASLTLATFAGILERADSLLVPEGGHAFKREVGWEVLATLVVSGTNRLGYLDAHGNLEHVLETQLGGRRADPTGEGLLPDGHWAWAQTLHGDYVRHIVEGGEPGTLPANLPTWVNEAALVPARASSPSVLQRLQNACPGWDIRPFAPYVSVSGLGGCAVSVDATPARWRDAEWRLLSGKLAHPVEVEEFAQAVVHGDPTGLVVPETFRTVLRRWLGNEPPGVREPSLLEARVEDIVSIGRESDYLTAPTDPLADDREVQRSIYGARRCRECGGQLGAGRKNFCSPACRAAARRERRREPAPIRRCAGCGAELSGGRPQRRWCGEACRSRSRRAAR